MNIRRINIYAGPGAGKSTAAAGIYYNMAKDGFGVELVREFIKEEMVYRNIFPEDFDQTWVFGNQQNREQRALRHNPLIITDCPLLLCAMYARYYKAPGFDEIVALSNKFEEKYPSVNIFLDREGIRYKDNGRYQNLSQAMDIDQRIRDILYENKVKCPIFRTVDFEGILNYITTQLRTPVDGQIA